METMISFTRNESQNTLSRSIQKQKHSDFLVLKITQSKQEQHCFVRK